MCGAATSALQLAGLGMASPQPHYSGRVQPQENAGGLQCVFLMVGEVCSGLSQYVSCDFREL